MPIEGFEPFDNNSWLNSLGAYNLNEKVDTLLDLARTIETEGGYFYQGIPFPTKTNDVNVSGQAIIPAGVTFGGAISVQAGSILTSITSYSDQNEGFKFRIYDKGAKKDFFAGTVFGFRRIAAVSLVGDPTTQLPDLNSTQPFGPAMQFNPFIILPPGSLQIEITNLSQTNDALIQMLLNFAVPLTREATNEVIVEKGNGRQV